MSVTALSSAWRDWIRDGLERGCSQQQLVDVMLQNEFEANFARAAVSVVALEPRGAAAQKPPTEPMVPHRFPLDGNTVPGLDRPVQVLFRLERPRVILFGNILSEQECEQIINLSRNKVERSTTVDNATGKSVEHEARTSEGTFFLLNENELIERIDRRLAALLQHPIECGEGLQILHYNVGGEYRPHFDYFDPNIPGSKPHLEERGQRIGTLVMYLNDVEAGGETIFPDLGLSVAPRRGHGVYFEYSDDSGTLDPLSLHGGAPVIRGDKWIATKWLRQRASR
ncbi:2OG-Fe(II) oxygenase [Chitinimonas lacunae]|uniref:2OG-Fe(II) oxygenase n=1 Tax=Chitinimonas lacunae TaxID=1963018 RepID=A0ABV8MN43_9NEIS